MQNFFSNLPVALFQAVPNNDLYGICDKSVSCNNLQYSPFSINLFI